MNKFNENSDISKNAYEFSCQNLSNSNIFEILEKGEDYEKPIAILNFTSLNQEEAKKLIFYLTNQNAPVREAVSTIIAEFCPKIENDIKEKIVSALCDVNPNVCRNVVEFLKKTNSEVLKADIIKRIEILLDEIEKECAKFKKNMEKNHLLNKKIFHLYWCLEGLCSFIKNVDENTYKILQKTSEFYDYTIREKTAQILNTVYNPPQDLIQKLKSDDNFYVRNKFKTVSKI